MSDEVNPMKPSRYLDNDSNKKWEWHNNGEKVEIVTIHDHPKQHMHKADVTKVHIGDMVDNPDPIIGEAHRNSAHYYKDGTVKPPKINNRKDLVNMSRKEHRAFCERLNPANYGNSMEPAKTTSKKSDNNEDENKGQLELALPESKNKKAVQKMKSDIRMDSNRSQNSNKQNTLAKIQHVDNKSVEGQSMGANSIKTANSGIGKNGNIASNKGGIGIGGKGEPGGHCSRGHGER